MEHLCMSIQQRRSYSVSPCFQQQHICHPVLQGTRISERTQPMPHCVHALSCRGRLTPSATMVFSHTAVCRSLRLSTFAIASLDAALTLPRDRVGARQPLPFSARKTTPSELRTYLLSTTRFCRRGRVVTSLPCLAAGGRGQNPTAWPRLRSGFERPF
jgi:hypothetical protein